MGKKIHSHVGCFLCTDSLHAQLLLIVVLYDIHNHPIFLIPFVNMIFLKTVPFFSMPPLYGTISGQEIEGIPKNLSFRNTLRNICIINIINIPK